MSRVRAHAAFDLPPPEILARSLACAARLRITVLVRKRTTEFVSPRKRIADSRRPVNAMPRLIQAGSENFADLWLTVTVRIAQHADAVRLRFRDEEIRRWARCDHARVRELVRELFARKPAGTCAIAPGGCGISPRVVPHRFGRVRRW